MFLDMLDIWLTWNKYLSCCHFGAGSVKFTVPNAALTILALDYQPFPLVIFGIQLLCTHRMSHIMRIFPEVQ